MQTCNDIIAESLREEMVMSYEEQWKNKITDSELNDLIETVANKDLQLVKKKYASASLDVAYDMGWQKRSGGCVYDSLSGHGFIIGQ